MSAVEPVRHEPPAIEPAPRHEHMLEAKGLSKALGAGEGRVQVLKGIDLVLEAGELTLLMGPSGSGKTTLLSILGCILAPDAGTLSICGQSTEHLDAEGLAAVRRLRVGLVFQSYNLFPTLTATENIQLALDVRASRSGSARERAVEALKAVGMSHRADAYPGTLSGGEKQRLAIARALAGAPSIVLADEPTAALDAENGRAVMELLREVARDRSRAVLAVTHDHRTLAYADRVLHIEDGRIIADERPRAGRIEGAEGAKGAEQAHQRHTTADHAVPPSPVVKSGKQGRRKGSRGKRSSRRHRHG